MKKIVSITIVLIISISMVFAAEVFDAFKADIEANKNIAFAESLDGYKPSNPQSMGMGGAGLAINDGLDTLFYNPSILGQGKVRFSIPSVTMTMNHVYDLLKEDENGNSALDNLQSLTGEGGMENAGELLPLVSSLIGSGKGKIASVETSVGMMINVFGVAMNVNDTIRTYNGSIFDDLKVSSVVGLGFGFGGEEVKINVGLAGKLNINAFTQRMEIKDFMSSGNSEEGESSPFSNIPVAYGYAIPFDAGITVKYHSLKATATLTDIDLFGLGEYKYDMVLFADVASDPSSVGERAENIEENSVFKFTPKAKLNFGFAFDTETATGIKLAFDLVDVLSMQDALDAGYSFKGVFLGHMKAGAEFSLFNFLKVRGGINSGYFTMGGSVNIGLITVDAAYFWEELGSFAGERGLDGMSIRINIGWDN